MKVFCIHGAFSTFRSFNYIINVIDNRNNLKHSNFTGFMPISYNMNETLNNITDRTFKEINECNDEKVIVIGHSLGGLIAADLAQNCKKISHCITISTPFGGVTPFHGGDIATKISFYYSNYLMKIRNTKFLCPVTPIISSLDNVVSISSQTVRSDLYYHEYPLNHFEILLEYEIALIIENIIVNEINPIKEL